MCPRSAAEEPGPDKPAEPTPVQERASTEAGASPGAGAREALSRLGRSAVLLTAFLLMFTFLTFPPAPEPANGGYEADASLSCILTYAQEHGLQFGTDLAYTYGPLGYLVFFYFSPSTAPFHMATDVALCFTAALGLCLLGWRLKWLWRLLMLAGFTWGAANIFPRTDLVLNLGFLCWGLLCFVENDRKLSLACCIFSGWAAFAALAKVSYLFVGAGCVLFLTWAVWVRGRRQLALGMVLGTTAAFLGGWLLAGQGLGHLGAYGVNGVAMAMGYNAALGWETLPLAASAALILLLLLLPLLALRVRWAFDAGERRPRLLRALLLAWLGFLTFTVYKHGFVRGFVEDLNPFFLFMAVLGLVLALFHLPRPVLGRWAGALTIGCWLLPLLTLQALSFPPLWQSASRPFRMFAQNFHWVVKPGDYLSSASHTFEATLQGAQLPRLSARVGNASLGVFGRRQLYAMANDLDYRPSPVPQTYAACTARLMQLNEQFYLSSSAPEYVLFQLDSFDRKFPPLEDAWTLRDLLFDYRRVDAENGFLLLKNATHQAPKMTLLRSGTIRPGEPIDLGQYGRVPVWLELELKPSWAGWLRQVLYRPPVVRLAAWGGAGQKLLVRRRSPASMLAAGFLASPLVLNNQDVSALYESKAAVRPDSYSVEFVAGASRFWKSAINVRIYKIENPLGRLEPELASRTREAGPAGKGKGASESSLAARHRFALFHSSQWRSGPAPGSLAEMLTYTLFVLWPCAPAALLVLLARRLRRSGKPARWYWLVAGNALVLSLFLSLAFLAAETYFRFFYDTTDSLGFTKVSERWVQRHWHLNHAGLRDDVDYSPLLQPGKRRITFIGDSFAAGHGIDNVENRFANRLRRAHPDWDIQVLAKVGLNTGGEQILLNRALRQGYQLQDVVLVYCLNDVGDLMPAQSHAYDRLFAAQQGWLVRNSYFINLLYNHYQATRIPLLKNYFPFVRQAYQGAAWQEQQQRLKAFRDTVQAHGGRLAVVTFPFFDVLGPKYPYKSVHAELDRFWRALHVPNLDLLQTYQGFSARQLTVNPYDAHPNELANKLAADALDKFLGSEMTGNSPNPPSNLLP